MAAEYISGLLSAVEEMQALEESMRGLPVYSDKELTQVGDTKVDLEFLGPPVVEKMRDGYLAECGQIPTELYSQIPVAVETEMGKVYMDLSQGRPIFE
jgi:hypothetical protein